MQVICIWLLLLAGEGTANIAAYPGILRAFDPPRAVMRVFTRPLSDGRLTMSY